MQPAPPPGDSRIDVLDGLRGVAILLVMSRHLWWSTGDASPPLDALFHLLAWPTFGVDLFFVLSGFLITGVLLRAKQRTCMLRDYLKTFFVRRMLRIFPLYYLALLISLAIVPVFSEAHRSAVSELSSQLWWIFVFLTNVPQSVHNSWFYEPVYLGHLWTLAVEEHFYLVWPALVWFTSRRGFVRATVCVMVACLALRFVMGLYGVGMVTMTVCSLTRFDSIAMGALWAAVLQDPACDMPRVVRSAILCALAGAAGYASMAGFDEWWNYKVLAFSCLNMFFGGALALCVAWREVGLVRALLANRPLRFLGKYAYGLFIWHCMLAPVFLHGALTTGSLQGVVNPHGLAVILRNLLWFALSLAAALSSWRLLEKPFLDLRKR